jgi:opacity protein-like surface antigen
MQKLKLVAALTLALAASASFAQTSKSGFYGLGQFGSTSVKTTTAADNNSYTADGTSAGNAWNFGLGYDFNQNFGVEATYGYVWKAEKEENSRGAGWSQSQVSKTNVTGLTISALAKLPVTANINLMAGPTYTFLSVKNEWSYKDNNNATVSGSSTQNKGLAGLTVGASFALDNKTDFRVTYTQFQDWKSANGNDNPPTHSTDKISSLLFGMSIKF